ncbi:hypothetical protein YC2023_018075 [Brassica napus]
MAEPDDSSTKDKPGWINGEDTDLKPADETEDELEPAEESMLELKPAEVIVDELDELSELSDTSLELNELSDTEDGAGLVAGRNEHFSAQRKIHNKFNLGRFYTKFDQTFPQSISSPFSSRMPRGSQQGSLGRGGREILLAEEKSSLGVVNMDFKTILFIFLSCVHLLLAWRNPLGYLICSLRTLRGDS